MYLIIHTRWTLKSQLRSIYYNKFTQAVIIINKNWKIPSKPVWKKYNTVFKLQIRSSYSFTRPRQGKFSQKDRARSEGCDWSRCISRPISSLRSGSAVLSLPPQVYMKWFHLWLSRRVISTRRLYAMQLFWTEESYVHLTYGLITGSVSIVTQFMTATWWCMIYGKETKIKQGER